MGGIHAVEMVVQRCDPAGYAALWGLNVMCRRTMTTMTTMTILIMRRMMPVPIMLMMLMPPMLVIILYV